RQKETDPRVRGRGSNRYYLGNNAYVLSDGRNFSSQDIRYARKVAIIGSDIREELFINEYPLGKSIRTAGQQDRVIGMLEAKGSIFGQSLDEFVLIPYTTGLMISGGNR